MRVLLITLFYAPDLGPSAPLFTMLCEDLVRLGHDVTVVAAVPHYPTGKVPQEFRGWPIQREERNGVHVFRVWVPSVNRARLEQRFLSFICYQILATLAGLRCRYDVLIVSNPALEVAFPFLILGAFRRKPIIYSVHDIYPDVGIKLGIFRHRLVIKLVDKMESFCLNRASCVRVLSEGFKQTLKSKGIPSTKLALIWDWLDTDFIQPLPRANEFSIRWGFDKNFVVMYAGNIGLSQGLEQVVDAAKILATEPAILFVIVGDGASKDSLQHVALSSGLSNIEFVPFQPRELLTQVLASADISLITLKRGIGTDSVPSKCYSILASGRPVVASVDQDSDTWHLIHEANCGLCVMPENPQDLSEAILRLYQDEKLRMQLGINGRNYVVWHHSRMAAAQQFDGLLQSIVTKN